MASHDAHQDDTRTPLTTSQEEAQNGDSPAIATPDTLPEQRISPPILPTNQAEPSANTISDNTLSSDATFSPETPTDTADSKSLQFNETILPETPDDIPDEPLTPETLDPGAEAVGSETFPPETPVEPAPDENLALDETLPSDQQPTTEAEPLAPADTSEPGDLLPPSSNQTGQPAPPTPPARRKRLDRTAALALCLALVLLLLGSGGLILDLTYYHPNQVALGATATANAQDAGTANSAQTQIANSNATNTALEQATAQVYQNIYQSVTSGKPVLSDSLNHQSSLNWDEYNVSGQDFCGFKNGSYHNEQIAIHYFNPCGEDGRGFGNFALQIDMTIVGGDYGGIMFRGHDGFFYYFEIDLNGDYSFDLYNYKRSNTAQQLDTGSTGYMHGDYVSANEITLIAEGNTFYVYVNQHFIESVTDSSYQSGWFGLIADSYQNDTDVAFSNLKIWQL